MPKKKIHQSIGHHYIVEASGCDPKIISSVEEVQQILVKAAEISGAQVWAVSVSRFPPKGVSGVIVISESHISTHTWPEYGYAAVDLFTCGDTINPWVGFDYLENVFKAERSESMEVARGMTDKIRRYAGIEGPITFKPADEEEAV